MYTYNKNDKSYTFSSDELDFENLIEVNDTINEDSQENPENSSETPNERPPKIEIINGGNDLEISPVSDYLEIEKPKIEKRENIVIPEEKKD